jgi:hypothetical protein
MHTLALTLRDQDHGYLRIISELWGIDLASGSAADTAVGLAGAMLDKALLAEVIGGLPPAAHEALDSLMRNHGRLPMADLTRKFGPMRQMGPGRRDREQPWRNETSPIEALWYRGLVGRAFFDTATGPQEFGYVPEDLAALVPVPGSTPDRLPLHPIDPPAETRPATDFAVDDQITVLAALRRQPAPARWFTSDRLEGLGPFLYQPHSAGLLMTCLTEERVLASDRLTPDPEAVRALLDCTRPEILRRARATWRGSERWNDLAQVPHLRPAGGEWPNDPLISRGAILDMLRGMGPGEWWDLSEFIQAVHDAKPGFQRPAGDFDSWYLQDTRTGSFVRGLAHWHAVEGALIHGVICGPLFWLGMLDLGFSGPDGPAIAFRLTAGFDPSSELEATPPTSGAPPRPKTQVRPDGLISVPRYAPPATRYQIARMCAWESRNADGYLYRLTPEGLALAASQGLQPNHVRTILESASGSPLPETLIGALEHWSASGTRARLERMLVIHVADPAVLKELRDNRSTARFLRRDLGPRSASVAEKDWRRLCEAATRLGILIEPPESPGGIPS